MAPELIAQLFENIAHDEFLEFTHRAGILHVRRTRLLPTNDRIEVVHCVSHKAFVLHMAQDEMLADVLERTAIAVRSAKCETAVR